MKENQKMPIVQDLNSEIKENIDNVEKENDEKKSDDQRREEY